MTKNFKPMLAAKPAEGYKWQEFPWERGWLMSPRSLKPVPNRYIREVLNRDEFVGLDGEIVMNWNDPKTFSQTVSAVMSHDGEPRFEFRVFDHIGEPRARFADRLMMAQAAAESVPVAGFIVAHVPHLQIENYEEFASAEQQWVDMGFEGAMIRDALGGYKFGRSTWKEKGLIKVKRYEDAEGRIVDWKPLMRNNNLAKRNELGYIDRSSEAAGLEPDWDRIGALVVEIINGEFEGATVDIGGGFTDLERLDIRLDIEELIAKRALLTFKYMPHGSKDAPRHPIFKGLRGAE
jgi:DNA ligase-1